MLSKRALLVSWAIACAVLGFVATYQTILPNPTAPVATPATPVPPTLKSQAAVPETPADDQVTNRLPANATAEPRLSTPDTLLSAIQQAKAKGETARDTLKARAHEDPDLSTVVVPVTAQDREDLIANALAVRMPSLPEASARAAKQFLKARVPQLPSLETPEASTIVSRLAEAHLAFKLELHDAIQNELRTADLSVPSHSPGARGVAGSLQVNVQRPQDATPVRLQGAYFVSYDKYDRLKAADDSFQRALQESAEALRALASSKTLPQRTEERR